MYKIDFWNEVDGIASFMIDDVEYSEDGERAVVPVSVLKKTDISSVPYNFIIEICEFQCESMVQIKTPAQFQRIGEKEFSVRYEEFIERKYWDGAVGLKLYMVTKKSIIEERAKEVSLQLKYCYHFLGNWDL